MGNDISMVRCATAVALALVIASCASRETAPEESAPAETPATAPETTPAEGAAAGQPVELQPNAPMRYVVKKGDTLWSIANKYLKDSWQWPELWYVNPKVNNPHLIYPGDELYLYYVDGQPQL